MGDSGLLPCGPHRLFSPLRCRLLGLAVSARGQMVSGAMCLLLWAHVWWPGPRALLAWSLAVPLPRVPLRVATGRTVPTGNRAQRRELRGMGMAGDGGRRKNIDELLHRLAI